MSAEQLADWRWQVESFHKLPKSSGQQLESWQQESAGAVAKWLLLALMVCNCAWGLERQQTAECRRILVRLSGRQTKRSRPVTTSALIAGLMILLPLQELLTQYTPAQLQTLTQTAAPPTHEIWVRCVDTNGSQSRGTQDFIQSTGSPCPVSIAAPPLGGFH